MSDQTNELVLPSIRLGRRLSGKRAEELDTPFQRSPPGGPNSGIGQALLSRLPSCGLKSIVGSGAKDLLEHESVPVGAGVCRPDSKLDAIHMNVTALHDPIICDC